MSHLPEHNSYSVVSRRINDPDYSLMPSEGENPVIFSDGTDLQAADGGEYLREKYGKKKQHTRYGLTRNPKEQEKRKPGKTPQTTPCLYNKADSSD